MINIGTITLGKEELKTHVHGVGKSRSGKSKLIEHIARSLITQNKSFCLIDPHGTLLRDLLTWLAFYEPDREIYIFEPSNENRIVGFNPFYLQTQDPVWVMTKTEKMVAATLKAWGVSDPTSTPRLAKWLKRLYYTLVEQKLSITAVPYLTTLHFPRQRNLIIERMRNEEIKAQWKQLFAMKPSAFQSFMESTENRLEIFTHPQVRRIMGLQENCLDLRGIINGQKILLVNLQPSPVISDENNRVLGTLLINELWQVFRERTKAYPFYLLVDECQKYVTPDVSAMLDESAKYGLHMMLFHQRKEQLDKNLASALQNAQTKFIFSTDKEPKPQRHFRFQTASGLDQDGQVPNVTEYFVSEERVAAYKERLLANFLTASEVDRRLEMPNDERDLTDEDFLR